MGERCNMAKLKTCGSCSKIIDFNSDCSCRKKRNNYNNDKNKESKKPIQSQEYKDFRKRIIERDNFHCQRCMIKYGILETEYLQVHHIKSRVHYPELVYDESNVITVCRVCNNQLGTKDKLDFEWSVPKEEIEYNLD
jgi:5-methylcytosine-specific restriction endonuclease McrA